MTNVNTTNNNSNPESTSYNTAVTPMTTINISTLLSVNSIIKYKERVNYHHFIEK